MKIEVKMKTNKIGEIETNLLNNIIVDDDEFYKIIKSDDDHMYILLVNRYTNNNYVDLKHENNPPVMNRDFYIVADEYLKSSYIYTMYRMHCIQDNSGEHWYIDYSYNRTEIEILLAVKDKILKLLI